MKVLSATARRMRSPSTASRQNSDTTSQRTSDVSRRLISTAPMRTPIIDPDPPKMLTPPTTTAPTAESSSPNPATTVMLPKRERNRNAASPERAPEIRNARITVPATSIPANCAASGLDPTA